MRTAVSGEVRVIALSGLPSTNRPCRIVLSSISGWTHPAQMLPDASNVAVETLDGRPVVHWFEDARPGRAVLWLEPVERIVLRILPRRVHTIPPYHPHAVGLLGGINAAQGMVLPHAWRAYVIREGDSSSFWNMTPKLWRTANGRIGCAWFGGAATEIASPKQVYVSFSTDGLRWSTPQAITTPSGHSFASCAAAFAYGGSDHLIIATAASSFEPKTNLWLLSSSDNGATWSSPQAVSGVTSIGTGGNNDTVFLKDGRIAFTSHDSSFNCYINVCNPSVSLTQWSQHLICSGGPNYQEPALVQLRDGTLIAFLRTNAGYVYRAVGVTSGSGFAWSTPQATSIPNPNSKCQAAVLPDDTVLLCGNFRGPVNQSTPGERVMLGVAVSRDGGQTFGPVSVIGGCTGHSPQYPSLLVNGDRLVLVCAVSATNNTTYRSLWPQVLSIPALLHGLHGWHVGGGGCSLDGSAVVFRAFNEGMQIATPPGWQWDGSTPLKISVTCTAHRDFMKRGVVRWGRMAPSGSYTYETHGSIGGDTNANSWEWTLNPATGSYQKTGITLPIHGAIDEAVVIVESSGWFAYINGTRKPNTGYVSPLDTSVINSIILGRAVHGSFSGDYCYSTLDSFTTRVFSASVAENPVDLSGSLV